MKKNNVYTRKLKLIARSNIYTFIILYRKRTRLFVIKFWKKGKKNGKKNY